MGKKLVGNGIIESSRMILTEHRDAYLEHMHQLNRREKPILDDQELQMIALALSDSYKNQSQVDIVVFHPFDNLKFSGVVESINAHTREVRLLLDEDYYSVNMSKIISAECRYLY